MILRSIITCRQPLLLYDSRPRRSLADAPPYHHELQRLYDDISNPATYSRRTRLAPMPQHNAQPRPASGRLNLRIVIRAALIEARPLRQTHHQDPDTPNQLRLTIAIVLSIATVELYSTPQFDNIDLLGHHVSQDNNILLGDHVTPTVGHTKQRRRFVQQHTGNIPLATFFNGQQLLQPSQRSGSDSTTDHRPVSHQR